MTARLEPLWDTVVVKSLETHGRLFLPQTSEGTLAMQRGEVIAVADSIRRIRVGDQVFVAARGRAYHTEVVKFEGDLLLICPSDAVLAIIREEAPLSAPEWPE